MSLLNSYAWGWLLWPLSLLYRGVIALRNALYDRGWLIARRSRCTVISIGNLTVGGTGKTPMTQLIIRRLLHLGHRPAVISRGYGRKKKGVAVVSDGKRLMMVPEECGDEPSLIARRFPSIPVVVASRRSEGAAVIERNWDCDCIVLDDAFQHRAMARDLDIVLADSINGFGNGKLLPAGPCREPLSSFSRAQAVIMTHTGIGPCGETLESRIRQYSNAPVFHTTHAPREWIQWPEGKRESLHALENHRVLAFAGLGNPDGFRRTIESLNLELTDLICFRDHYWYNGEDMDRLMVSARENKASILITTAKDIIRIPKNYKSGLPIYALRIEMEIFESLQELDRLIEGVFQTQES